jgi:hypothetical protein
MIFYKPKEEQLWKKIKIKSIIYSKLINIIMNKEKSFIFIFK